MGAGGIIKNAGNNLTKVDPQNNHGQMKRAGLKRSKRRGRRSSSRNRNLLRGMGNNKIVPEINLEQMRKTRNANNRKGLTGNKDRLEKKMNVDHIAAKTKISPIKERKIKQARDKRKALLQSFAAVSIIKNQNQIENNTGKASKVTVKNAAVGLVITPTTTHLQKNLPASNDLNVEKTATRSISKSKDVAKKKKTGQNEGKKVTLKNAAVGLVITPTTTHLQKNLPASNDLNVEKTATRSISKSKDVAKKKKTGQNEGNAKVTSVKDTKTTNDTAIVKSKGAIKRKTPKRMKLLKLRNKVKQKKEKDASKKNELEENVTRLIQHEAIQQFMGIAKTKRGKITSGQNGEEFKKSKVGGSTKNVTLHSEDVKTLHQIFNDLDKNNNGTLEKGEFRRAALKRPDLGTFVRPKDFLNSFTDMDTSHDGSISLDEFVSFCIKSKYK